ncbi:CHAT domain-containing protein [Chaetomium sp. MPI-CAGE-AT-0009]|nr:CHAT domain-containing protein [Chaetomium sp. MPI-CAGE-AT-0009]
MDILKSAVENVCRAIELLKQQPEQLSAKKELDDALTAAGEVLDDRLARIWGYPPADTAPALEHLNQVIQAAELILSVVPTKNQLRFVFLRNLSASLPSRFDLMARAHGGKPDSKDLERAVEFALAAAEEAASAEGTGDGMGLDCRVQAVKLLTLLFEATQNTDSIERAVAVAQGAVNAIPKGNDNTNKGAAHRRQLGLNTLARALGMRFDAKGVLEDLDSAIALLDSSLPSLGADDSNYVLGLDYLGILLGTRFEQQGDVTDLNEAIRLSEDAAMRALSSDPDRPRKLQNLADRLASRARYTEEVEDLERAIEYNGDASCLNRAVAVLEEAVGLSGQNPEKAFLHYGLGQTLLLRYHHARIVRDAEGAIHAYGQSLDSEMAPPTVRVNAAVRAAELLGSLGRWAEATEALERAVHLLHMLTPLFLQADNKQQLIGHISGVGAAAAAAALHAGKSPGHALRYLELGRGIISGFLFDMHADTSALRQAHPDLADRFSWLSERLAGQPKLERYCEHQGQTLLPQGLMPGAPSPGKERWRRWVGREMEKLIEKIRSQPGFEHFLLPPTAEQLMAAAVPGPIIVVNVSEWRCDAFLVQSHQIRVVPLPDLSQERVIEENRRIQTGPGSLSDILKWLWDAIVHPALDALGFKGRNHARGGWPRVWWVAVGPLSGLPLHAAGNHGSHNGETALDRVMSSYSSSIKALIAGRTSQPPPLSPSAPGRMLLISMSNTPGQDHLEFSDREVAQLSELCPSMHLTAERSLSLTKGDVLGRLRGCRVFHFAGHGITDPTEPSRSCLLLKDWEAHPLTVGDLREERLQEIEPVGAAGAPFLAYLSACSTAANEKLALTDEAIHLVSACQLAGFRHVVGTLWTVSDAFCADVARRFYEIVRDEGATDTAVCHGLHLAMRELRDSGVERSHETAATTQDNNDDLDRGAIGIPGPRRPNLRWVPYVHFGV